MSLQQAQRHLKKAKLLIAEFDQDAHKHVKPPKHLPKYQFPHTEMQPMEAFTSNFRKIMKSLLEKPSAKHQEGGGVGGGDASYIDNESPPSSPLHRSTRQFAEEEDLKDHMLQQLRCDIGSPDEEFDAIEDDMKNEILPMLTLPSREATNVT